MSGRWMWISASLVCLWSAWMAFGRIYCVMHTPGDTYLGYTMGLCLAIAWSGVDDTLMTFAKGSALAPAYGLVIVAMAAILYPMPLTKHTPCHEQTVSFAGVAYGVMLGIRLCDAQCLGITKWASFDAAALASPQRLPNTIARLAVLAVTLAASLKCSRPILRPCLHLAMSLAPPRLRASWEPPLYSGGSGSSSPPAVRLLHSGRPADVESAARFASYAMVGLASIWTPYYGLCKLGWT
mmetsp:Transcript_35885/g.101616  ORF Transcript_35885/g.101616 Transcript_35885/m.101616 type:complete len:239 (-) Transcript_35885:1182-1898(-)